GQMGLWSRSVLSLNLSDTSEAPCAACPKRQLNLLARGNPFGGNRPAWARSPTHSLRSVTLKVRPDESIQVNPSLYLKPTASDSPPSLYFCSRTPFPRVISGTSAR